MLKGSVDRPVCATSMEKGEGEGEGRGGEGESRGAEAEEQRRRRGARGGAEATEPSAPLRLCSSRSAPLLLRPSAPPPLCSSAPRSSAPPLSPSPRPLSFSPLDDSRKFSYIFDRFSIARWAILLVAGMIMFACVYSPDLKNYAALVDCAYSFSPLVKKPQETRLSWTLKAASCCLARYGKSQKKSRATLPSWDSKPTLPWLRSRCRHSRCKILYRRHGNRFRQRNKTPC